MEQRQNGGGMEGHAHEGEQDLERGAGEGAMAEQGAMSEQAEQGAMKEQGAMAEQLE